jgi:hypothetical protein
MATFQAQAQPSVYQQVWFNAERNYKLRVMVEELLEHDLAQHVVDLTIVNEHSFIAHVNELVEFYGLEEVFDGTDTENYNYAEENDDDDDPDGYVDDSDRRYGYVDDDEENHDDDEDEDEDDNNDY